MAMAYQAPATHSVANVRGLHVSMQRFGLEEFFDDKANWGLNNISYGAAWSKGLLRKKNAVELHQLWFILLKERNMLQTQEHYCLDNDDPIPGEGRLLKVAESMGNLRDVIQEREEAKNMLLLGRKSKTSEERRTSPLGFNYVYKHREHFLPEEHASNNAKGRDQPAEIAVFGKVHNEMHMRIQERRIKSKQKFKFLQRLQYRQLKKANPSLPQRYPEWFKMRHHATWKFGLRPRTTVMLKETGKHDSRKQHTKNPRSFFERV